MKKLIVATMLALMVVAVPAFAAQRDGNWGGNDDWFDGGFNNGFDDSGVIQAPTQTFVSGSNQNTGGAVTGGGDNSNTCSAQENFNNSGGVLNSPSLQQFGSPSNDGSFFDNRGRSFDNGFSGNGGVLFGGPSFTNAPNQSASCEPTVQQAASSSSGS